MKTKATMVAVRASGTSENDKTKKKSKKDITIVYNYWLTHYHFLIHSAITH